MMDLLSKFLKVEALFLATCTSTFAIARKFLQLPEHFRFVGCERNSACFQGALPLLVKYL